MTVETGLVAFLRADPGVSAIIGQKIYPEKIPQNTALPALVYSRIISEREQMLAGQRDLIQVRLRVDCWESSYAACWSLANAVRSALNGITGDMGGFTVQQVYLDGEQNLSDFEGDRSDYRVTQEYVIMYVEV